MVGDFCAAVRSQFEVERTAAIIGFNQLIEEVKANRSSVKASTSLGRCWQGGKVLDKGIFPPHTRFKNHTTR